MPFSINGIGTRIYRSRAVLRRDRGDGTRLDFDGVECLAIFFLPLLPYKAIHIWNWHKGGAGQGFTYKAIPIRWSFRLVAGLVLRWWLWLPLLLGLLLSVSPNQAWYGRIAGLALAVAAAGAWTWLLGSDATHRQIRRLLSRHQLGSSDPVTWTDDVLAKLAPARVWFGTRSFAAAVEPLLDDGCYSEAMWAARLTAALEKPARGKALTAQVLRDRDVQELLDQLQQHPGQAKKLLQRQNEQPYPLWQTGEENSESPNALGQGLVGCVYVWGTLGLMLGIIMAVLALAMSGSPSK